MPSKATAGRAKGATVVETAEKLPHEHDETPETGAPPSDVMTQAARDVRRGLVDTDNYTRIRGVARRALEGRKRRGR